MIIIIVTAVETSNLTSFFYLSRTLGKTLQCRHRERLKEETVTEKKGQTDYSGGGSSSSSSGSNLLFNDAGSN
jgi:hypothetical protein